MLYALYIETVIQRHLLQSESKKNHGNLQLAYLLSLYTQFKANLTR